VIGWMVVLAVTVFVVWAGYQLVRRRRKSHLRRPNGSSAAVTTRRLA
jgi:hypothetical protein